MPIVQRQQIAHAAARQAGQDHLVAEQRLNVLVMNLRPLLGGEKQREDKEGQLVEQAERPFPLLLPERRMIVGIEQQIGDSPVQPSRAEKKLADLAPGSLFGEREEELPRR